jgi:hypothetical protein
MTAMVKVFGCRPSQVVPLGAGRRTKTAQVRTRGRQALVYGDFGFLPAVMMAAPMRRWDRWGFDEGDFWLGGRWIGSSPRLIFGLFALVFAKDAPAGIGRNRVVAA